MTGDPLDEVALPALLRAGRGTYPARVIDRRLIEAGFTDLPRHGRFVLGGVANHGATVDDMLGGLAMRRPGADALVEALIAGGYLARPAGAGGAPGAPDITDRGRAAGAVVRAGIEEVDARLAAMISPAALAGLRAGLFALSEIRAESGRT